MPCALCYQTSPCYSYLSIMIGKPNCLVLCGLSALFVQASAWAAQVSVAVAANFAAPAQMLAAEFARTTGHKAVVSVGSSGKIYAQIKNAAPYDFFMSADAQTPAKLESEGWAVVGSGFTYATGRLVLWSMNPQLVDPEGADLRLGGHIKFDKIALADPKLSPYGLAAEQVMQKLGVYELLKSKFVHGENIAQTYQFVATQNAQIGFVALSQVWLQGRLKEGSAWQVPSHLHSPIRQDAIMLKKAKENPAAAAWAAFIQTEKAKVIIRNFGYES